MSGAEDKLAASPAAGKALPCAPALADPDPEGAPAPDDSAAGGSELKSPNGSSPSSVVKSPNASTSAAVPVSVESKTERGGITAPLSPSAAHSTRRHVGGGPRSPLSPSTGRKRFVNNGPPTVADLRRQRQHHQQPQLQPLPTPQPQQQQQQQQQLQQRPAEPAEPAQQHPQPKERQRSTDQRQQQPSAGKSQPRKQRSKPTTTAELHSQHPKVYRYDGYEDLQPIGKGKFATVYRGVRAEDGRCVAIKRVHNFGSLSEKKREKCIKEVGLLQTFDHPNIIGYLDSFQSSNDLIIVCEWAEAGDLKRQIRKALSKRARFHEYTIWKYFLQIAEALRYMHSHRVLHRDLKPANIFITADACIKVGDLGLSRGLSDETIMVYTKVGTPLYMSPEVIVGGGYNHPSDVWSLGCILYELCALHSPFKEPGLNLASLFEKIKRGKYPPISRKYSPHLHDLISRMLSVDPNARPSLDEVCEIATYMKHESARQRAIRRAQEHAQRVMRQQQEMKQQQQLQQHQPVQQPLQQAGQGSRHVGAEDAKTADFAAPQQPRPAQHDGSSPPLGPKIARRPQRLSLQNALPSGYHQGPPSTSGSGTPHTQASPSPKLLTAFSPSPVVHSRPRNRFSSHGNQSLSEHSRSGRSRGRIVSVDIAVAGDHDEQAAMDAAHHEHLQAKSSTPHLHGSDASSQPTSSPSTDAVPGAVGLNSTPRVEVSSSHTTSALSTPGVTSKNVDLFEYAREMGRQVARMGALASGHAALEQASEQLRQQRELQRRRDNVNPTSCAAEAGVRRHLPRDDEDEDDRDYGDGGHGRAPRKEEAAATTSAPAPVARSDHGGSPKTGHAQDGAPSDTHSRGRCHTCPSIDCPAPVAVAWQTALKSPLPRNAHRFLAGTPDTSPKRVGAATLPRPAKEVPRPLSEPSDFLAGVDPALKCQIDAIERGKSQPRNHPLETSHAGPDSIRRSRSLNAIDDAVPTSATMTGYKPIWQLQRHSPVPLCQNADHRKQNLTNKSSTNACARGDTQRAPGTNSC